MQVPINIMLLVQLLLNIFDLKKIISSIILIIHYQKKQNKKNIKNNSGGDDEGTLFVDVERNAPSKGCILNPMKKATSTKTIMNGIHFILAVKYLANHAMNHQIPHYTEIKLEGLICMALALYNVIKVLMLMMSFFETKPLKIDPEGDGLTAPRHYTVTSKPGADFLQCTIKKIKGGKVSTYVHDKLKVGDIVQLTAPFDVFTVKPEEVESAVLISAGIGVTPMINFSESFGDKVKLTVHVDSTPEAYARRDLFAKSGNHIEKFTRIKGGKRPKCRGNYLLYHFFELCHVQSSIELQMLPLC